MPLDNEDNDAVDFYAIENPNFLERREEVDGILSHLPFHPLLDVGMTFKCPPFFIRVGDTTRVFVVNNYIAAMHAIRAIMTTNPYACPVSVLIAQRAVPIRSMIKSPIDKETLRASMHSGVFSADALDLINKGQLTPELALEIGELGRATRWRAARFPPTPTMITQITKRGLRGEKYLVNVPAFETAGFTCLNLDTESDLQRVVDILYFGYLHLARSITFKFLKCTTPEVAKASDKEEQLTAAHQFVSRIQYALVQTAITTFPNPANLQLDEIAADFMNAAVSGEYQLNDRTCLTVGRNVLFFMVIGFTGLPIWRGLSTALPTTYGYGFLTRDRKYTLPSFDAYGMPESYKHTYYNVQISTIIAKMANGGITPDSSPEELVSCLASTIPKSPDFRRCVLTVQSKIALGIPPGIY